jgi:hypothetical protein
MNEKLKEFIQKLNKKGIPLPMVRDPKTGESSVTLTLVFISFNTALVGQVGKIAGILGGIDLTQANYLFLMCLGAYLGRKMQGDSRNLEMDGDKDGKKE